MRSLGLTILILAVAAAVSAQDPKAQRPTDTPSAATKLSPKNQQLLDACLDAWEKRIKKIEALVKDPAAREKLLKELGGEDKK